MAKLWNIQDIEGYVRLLDSLGAQQLSADMFSHGCIALWTADRDLKAAHPAEDRSRQADAVLRDAALGKLSFSDFGQRWADLWACGYERPRAHALIIDLLHHWAYHYTSDEVLRSQEPRMYIDEDRLREVMMALRQVLRCLTEEDWP